MVDYTQKVLEVKNLIKHFKVGSGRTKLVVPAVDDVTFDVYKREVFGIVGESGSGKTTTGRTIIKLYNPTQGTVTLNGVTIGAGYADHVEQIKQLKKQAKFNILSLNPSKLKAFEIKQKTEQEIGLIEGELAALEKKHAQEIKEEKGNLEKHAHQLYQLKTQQDLDTDAVIFDFNQKRNNLLLQTQNQALKQLNNELSIAEVKYNHMVTGLKDSAALTKKTIEQRLESLKQDYEKTIAELKARFEKPIELAALNILPKEDVKEQIKKLTSEKEQKLADLKIKYSALRSQVVAPDKAQHDVKMKVIENNFLSEKKKLLSKIKELIKKQKGLIQALPRETMNEANKAHRNQKIKQIKTELQLKIKEQKGIIAEIKRINGSKDTLIASQKMQMIFQDPISSLNPRMTVREIVGEGLIIQGGYTKDEITTKVKEALELVGLAPEYASRYPHEFSGGQRQRIGIARALITNPNVIIADEPISALDVSIRAQVINLLFQLREKLGLTIIFIAHDLSVVRFFCDRIAVMLNGKVVELASSEELFKNPLHPYTISLLSAIPEPDPDYEKNRQRIHYNASKHDYRNDKPTLKEIAPGHLVYANNAEFESMKQGQKK